MDNDFERGGASDQGSQYIGEEQESHISLQEEGKKARVIVLSGPTAAGKSAFAMQLAALCCGEIISSDSMQIYRGMDIGTAKPPIHDQDSIAHHLIDIRDVAEDFSVAEFYYAAKQAIDSVIARNKVPIIVGGSGFYLHTLIYGPPDGPPSVPKVRAKLEKECDAVGTEALYERLQQLDSEYAKSITFRDRQKIIRALEIMSLTSKRVSQLPWKSRLIPKDYDFRCWFLTRPRSMLYERAEYRCDQMLAHGLIGEVAGLKDVGLLCNRSASQAIGYKQTLQFLEEEGTLDNYRHYVAEFKKATRHYVKRQLTWFRQKESLFTWLDLDLHDCETALDCILHDFLS